MRCEWCSAQIPDGASACIVCGAAAGPAREAAKPVSRITFEDLAPKPSKQLLFGTAPAPSLPAVSRRNVPAAPPPRTVYAPPAVRAQTVRPPVQNAPTGIQRAVALACILSALWIGNFTYSVFSIASAIFRPAAAFTTPYSQALTLYEEGRYEDAYIAFTDLGDYLDSSEMAESCIQPYPENGVVEQAGETGTVRVKLRNVTDRPLFIEMYMEEPTRRYWGSVWIGAGETAEVLLPEGRYNLLGFTGTF